MSYNHYKGKCDRLLKNRDRYRTSPTSDGVIDFERIMQGEEPPKRPDNESTTKPQATPPRGKI